MSFFRRVIRNRVLSLAGAISNSANDDLRKAALAFESTIQACSTREEMLEALAVFSTDRERAKEDVEFHDAEGFAWKLSYLFPPARFWHENMVVVVAESCEGDVVDAEHIRHTSAQAHGFFSLFFIV